MSEIEHGVRELAYRLWEQAGRPDGRSDEFWFLAQQEMYGGAATSDGPEAAQLPPLEEPPLVAAQRGVPTGMPGERIAEQGVLDDRLADLAVPTLADSDDD
jgi:hypothetical protein